MSSYQGQEAALQTITGSPRAIESRARCDQNAGTTDFVHYVVHFAASREGRTCEMCRDKGTLEHTHYFQVVAAEA
jgi:hypothetical protein